MRVVSSIVLSLLLSGACVAEEGYSVDPVPQVEELIKTYQPLPQRLEKEGPLLTLSDCLNRSRENHPSVAASWARVLQSQASLQQIWALYYPTATLTLQEDVDQNLASPNSVKTLSLLLGVEQTANATLAVSQTLFDGGERREKVEAARQTLRSTYLTFENDWITQAQIVQSAYLNVVEQESMVVVKLLDLDRVKANRDSAQRFLEAGTKSLVDVTQAEIQVAQAEASLANQRNLVKSAWIQLAQTMACPVDEIKGCKTEELLKIQVQLPTLNEAMAELETHPQYLLYKAGELSNEASARAERKSMRPSFGVNTSLKAYDKYGVEANTWEVLFTLTIPLYDPTVGPQVDLYKAKVLEARENARNTRLQLIQEVESAFASSVGAQERAQASFKQARTALLNYDLALKRYRAGITDYTELLNALSFVSTAQSSYISALADERTAEINLLKATGAAARFTKEYFARKAGEHDLIRDLQEDLKSQSQEP